jgi:hypothetical protein
LLIRKVTLTELAESMIKLIPKNDLPKLFSYPQPFLRVCEIGIANLEPWHFLGGELLRKMQSGLAGRYPDSCLVPFARRQDNDDIACFDANLPEGVVIVHDFASASSEQRERFKSFYDWFRKAVEDLIEFDT